MDLCWSHQTKKKHFLLPKLTQVGVDGDKVQVRLSCPVVFSLCSDCVRLSIITKVREHKTNKNQRALSNFLRWFFSGFWFRLAECIRFGSPWLASPALASYSGATSSRRLPWRCRASWRNWRSLWRRRCHWRRRRAVSSSTVEHETEVIRHAILVALQILYTVLARSELDNMGTYSEY